MEALQIDDWAFDLEPPALDVQALAAAAPPSAWDFVRSFLRGLDWHADFWPAAALAALAVYLAGLGVAAARLILARARLERAAESGDPCPELGPDVRLSAGAAAPFASARGLVVLPRALAEQMSPRDLALVVAHERAHVARRDPQTFWALAWIDALFWINPFVRRQTARCRLAAELACDAEAVVAAQSPRAAYAGAFLAAVKHVASGAPRWAPGILRTRNMKESRMRLARIMSSAPVPRSLPARAGLAAAVLLIVPLGALQLVACATGAGRKTEAASPQERPPATLEAMRDARVSESTGRVLDGAIELLNKEDYAGARAKMGGLDLDGLSPYERARAEQILFNIAYQSKSFDEAREHLRAAIAAGGLDEEEVSNIRYQIAQTYMVQERWAEGAKALEAWFETAPAPTGAAYYLLAIASYQQGDAAKALPAAEKAVQLTDNPQESWQVLALSLYLQEKRYQDALPLLERLVARHPDKKTYRVQLSSVYGEVEDYEKAAEAMLAAYDEGLLTEDTELRRLVDLLTFTEDAERGAAILEKAMAEGKVKADLNAYEKLANAWIAARVFEKAISPLEKAASMMSNGDGYLRLGEVHAVRQEWEAAADALRRAIDKGGLRDAAYADLMMGIALYNLGRPEEAKPSFERASRAEPHAAAARGYLEIVDLLADTGDPASADLRKGLSLFGQRRFAEAEYYFQRARKSAAYAEVSERHLEMIDAAMKALGGYGADAPP